MIGYLSNLLVIRGNVMSELKRQAEKMGLQVGRNVAIYQVICKNQIPKEYRKKYEATVVGIYPYVFTVKQKGNGTIESFQYGQVVLTKEVRLN